METGATDREPPIRFGTSGWRGLFGEEITYPRLRAFVRGAAAWLRDQEPGGTVVVGWDGRFASRPMAETGAALLLDAGLQPVLSREPCPTPVAVHAIRRRRAVGGLVFTASHNPPEDHGVKVMGAWGGGIGAGPCREIEQAAARASRAPPHAAPPRGRDLTGRYRRDLERFLDAEQLRRSRLKVHYDAMHGTGSGVLDRVLADCGVRVALHRGEPDPRFGGDMPDPDPTRLRDLARALRQDRGLRLGLATDGDADRFGVLDDGGRMLTATQVIALLVDQLARTGRVRKGVAISSATGSLVTKVARHHGLPVVTTPVGFKHLSRALLDGAADVAGEESGGFAYEGFGRDKDGLLAGCLVAEAVARAGRPLRACIAELERRHGRSACGRRALPVGEAGARPLDRLAEQVPRRFDGVPVVDVQDDGGLKLTLADGFVMFRASGTEPVLRVYAEAPGPRKLQRRLEAATRWLERRG